MKTRIIIPQISRILFLAIAMLALIPINKVQAQEASQDALYIFRNDGGFEAFYYADIDHIGYSKVDTLGVEQKDYCVQEVYALDSIFRIPISAIDSVAFVTPSTIYKADVVRPDKTMTDYIVASDSVSWFRLSASAPSEIIPKVGDKLLIESPVAYLPEGFSGKVTNVVSGADGYTVETEEAAFEELFDRFVMKAAAGSPEAVAARTRGVTDGIDVSYQTEEPIELPTLTGSFSLVDFQGDAFKAFNENLVISLDGNLSGTYSVKPTLTAFRAFLYADVVEGVKYYQYMKMNRDETVSLDASGTLAANIDFPFTISPDKISKMKDAVLKKGGKGFSKKIGGFDVEFSWGLFINGKGTISNSLFLEKVGTSLMTVNYDEAAFHVPSKDDFYVRSAYNLQNDSVGVKGWAMGLSASVGIYAKAGAKIGRMKRTFETEARLEAGVRLEEDLAVTINDVVSTAMLERGKLYSLLNAEDNVSLSAYAGGAFTAKLKFWKEVNWAPINLSLEATLGKKGIFGAVPDMKSITWEADEKAPWRGTLTVPLARRLLFPKDIGMTVFDITDEENPVQAIDLWKPYSYISSASIPDIKETIEDLEPGRFYKAYPQVKLFGQPILADKEESVTLGPPIIKIEPKYVEFDEYNGYKEINVRTNIKNTEFTTDAPWMQEKLPMWNNEEGRLTVFVPELPDNVNGRKALVIGIGKDKDGKELLRDTVTVNQLRPVLKCNPTSVAFEKEGGSVTVQLETPFDDITLTLSEGINFDKFFTYEYDSKAKTIKVTAPENTTGKELTGNIVVKGQSPEGLKAEVNLNVIQKTEEEASGYTMSVTPESLTFTKDGGTQRFAIKDNIDYDAIPEDVEWNANIIWGSEGKWFDASWEEDDYVIKASANSTGKERSASIVFTISTASKSINLSKTVTVTQSAEDLQTGPILNYWKIDMENIDVHWKSLFIGLNPKWSEGDGQAEWALDQSTLRDDEKMNFYISGNSGNAVILHNYVRSDESSSYHIAEITFDITGIENEKWTSNSKISNVKVIDNQYGKETNDQYSHLEMTLPELSISSDYVGSSIYERCKWEGNSVSTYESEDYISYSYEYGGIKKGSIIGSSILTSDNNAKTEMYLEFTKKK